jgi:nucleoside-diphosphate-sugar epimerase
VKVLITGGTGFVGLTLARRLLARASLTGPSGRLEELDSVVLFDAVAPQRRPDGLDERVEVVAGDVGDSAVVRALVDRDDCSVFHLASILSGGGEADFDLAMRVNLEGSRNVLEACRARDGRPRVVFTSTVATFGGAEMPKTVGDTTKLTPETTYGTTKAIVELLVNDYTRRGFLDGRSAKLATVVIRPGRPNAAASSFVSSVFREPLAGRRCVLPVELETRMPVVGHRTVADGLIALHELATGDLGDDRTMNLPSISVTLAEMIESVRRCGGEGPIDVEPDPFVERIVGTWPLYVESERADRLGLPRDAGLDEIVAAYVEDFGRA